MKTEFKIIFFNRSKRVYQEDGNMYIIDKGERIPCKRVSEYAFEVGKYGWSLID